MSEMLQEGSEDFDAEEQAHWLSRIHTNGQIMNNIIRELLLLASIRQQENIPHHTVHMAEVIEGVLLRYEYTLNENNVSVTKPDQWPSSIGYSPWIAEIWANYLSNAIKYGGNPPQIELGYTELGDGCVKFWIRDNGPGLDQEEQQ